MFGGNGRHALSLIAYTLRLGFLLHLNLAETLSPIILSEFLGGKANRAIAAPSQHRLCT